MYEEYWQLEEKPFENTVDPKYLFLSSQHEEALSRLSYCIYERKGLGVLTGVFGCGKTLIAQSLINSLDKGKYEVSFVINPQLSHVELLREIIFCLGIRENLPILKTDLLHILAQRLYNNADDGKETIVIIDEAHIINDLLIFEELRLLLNFQYKRKFLLTLILLGQQELKDKLKNIKQFQQRLAVKCHLEALSEEETSHYIKHRLNVAGCKREIFEEESIRLIYKTSGGIPRRINQICDTALLLGFDKGILKIKREVIEEVIEDLEI